MRIRFVTNISIYKQSIHHHSFRFQLRLSIEWMLHHIIKCCIFLYDRAGFIEENENNFNSLHFTYNL